MRPKGPGSLAIPGDSPDGMIERLRLTVLPLGVEQLVLSHPETLASLVGFEQPIEDWPVAVPFNACPPLLIVTKKAATLACPSFYLGHARNLHVDVVELPMPKSQREVPVELQRTFPRHASLIGVEVHSLPIHIADFLRTRGSRLVPVDQLVVEARRIKTAVEIEAVRRASRLADTVQRAVKEHAESGLLEVDLAGIGACAMYRVAGRRVPAVLSVSSGHATATLQRESGAREIESGDLVLTDVSPWFAGAWSDSANTVAVGHPSADQRRIFDAVRRALDYAIELCRPGIAAAEVDRRVRASLETWGPSYSHHTGHGVGASWWEPPFIVPDNDAQIEEGMVLAAEPAIYRPGWGGIRLESVFVVGASRNDLLTEFEHTL